jgi:hypothetical protein
MITWKESFKFDNGVDWVELGLNETGVVYVNRYDFIVGGGYREKVSIKD